MKYFGFIILAFFSISLNGQLAQPLRPYEQVTYENLIPIWYETSYDSSLLDEYCDGYNYFLRIHDLDPIGVGDFVYSVYQIRGVQDNNVGAFIEKRSILDGSLLWQNYFDLNSNNRQEVPRIIYINEQNNLVIVGQKRVAPYGVNDPYNMVTSGSSDMRLTKREYDHETGDLLNFYDPNLEDETLANLEYVTIPDRGLISLINKIDNSKIRHVLNKRRFGDKFLYTYVVNDQGKQVGTIDTFQETFLQSVMRVKAIDANSYIYVEEEKDSLFHIKFKFLDGNLNLIREVKADTFDTWNALQFKGVSKNRLLFYNYVGNHPTRNYPIYDICVYSKQGELLMKARLDEEDAYSYYFTVLNWENGDNIYVLGMSRLHDEEDNFYTTLDVLKSNENDRFDIVNRFETEDPLRAANPDYNIRLENDKYLVFFQEFSWYILNPPFGKAVSPDNNAFARSIMLLDAEDLGFVPPSNTNEDLLEISAKFKVYPNPTSDYINIDFKSSFTGELHLINGIGQSLRKVSLNSSLFSRLNISELKTGVYYVIVTNNLGQSKYKKVIKID